MSALRYPDDAYEAMADEAEAQLIADLRPHAIEQLVEEALAQVPQWIAHWFEWKGEDLKAAARDAMAQDDEAIRDRVTDLIQQGAEQ